MSQKNSFPKKLFSLNQKKIFIPAAILLAAGLLFFIAKNRISLMAEKQLLELVNREFHPNAAITFEDFNLGLFPIRVTIGGIRLTRSEPFEEQSVLKQADAIRYLEVQETELRNPGLFRFLKDRQWHFTSLAVTGLRMELVPTSRAPLTDSSPVRHPPEFSVSDVTITGWHLGIYPGRKENTPSWLVQEADLHLQNVRIADAESPLHDYFDHFRLDIPSIKHNTEKGLYRMEAVNLSASSFDEDISLDRFTVTPLFPAYEMAVQTGYQIDTFDITSGPLHLAEIDINHWFKSGDFLARSLHVNELSLIITRDKTLPRSPARKKPLPNKSLKDLPFTVHLDSILFLNSYVSYTEEFLEEERSGTIPFSNVDLVIAPLQNYSESDPVSLTATTLFMDTVQMQLDAEFYITEKAEHTIRASVDGISLAELNQPIENLAFIRIQNGHLHSLSFSFHADDDLSDGEMIAIYDGLEIRFLDKSSLEEGGVTRLRSFLANSFAIRSDNPEEDPRIASMKQERDKERSFFTYWWHTVRQGLRESIAR